MIRISRAVLEHICNGINRGSYNRNGDEWTMNDVEQLPVDLGIEVEPEEREVCKTCAGSGEIICPTCEGQGNASQVKAARKVSTFCTECFGMGRISHVLDDGTGTAECPRCHGTKMEPDEPEPEIIEGLSPGKWTWAYILIPKSTECHYLVEDGDGQMICSTDNPDDAKLMAGSKELLEAIVIYITPDSYTTWAERLEYLSVLIATMDREICSEKWWSLMNLMKKCGVEFPGWGDLAVD